MTSSACKTLHWLLADFHKFMNETHILTLETDTNVLFDKQLMVRFLKIIFVCHVDFLAAVSFLPTRRVKKFSDFQEKYKWLRLSSFVIHASPTGRTAPVFSFSNVEISQPSDWHFRNLNLNISKCVLPNTKLYSTATQDHISANIINSLFGKISITGIQRVHIQNLIYHTENKTSDTLIEVMNSKLHMKNCNFSGKSSATGPTILWATSSQIVMEKINVEEVKAKQGLIHLHNSEMKMQLVSLIGNGFGNSSSSIYATKNSSVFVNGSTFENNIGANGSCFFVNVFSSLIIQKSTFLGNTGIFMGGVILAESGALISVKSSKFEGNTVVYTAFPNNSISHVGLYYPGGGVVMGDQRVSIIIDSCFFANNSCEDSSYGLRGTRCSDGSGVLNIYHSSNILVTNSTFSRNIAEYGILGVWEQCSATFQFSLFIENFGSKTIVVAPTGSINLTQCNFLSNIPDIPGRVKSNSSRYEVQELHFQNYLLLSDVNTSVSVTHCNFNNNTKHFIFYTNGISMNLERSNFTSNKGVVYGFFVSISALDCIFESNAQVIDASSVHISTAGCVFLGNRAVIRVTQFGSLIVANSTFQHNHHGSVVECTDCISVQMGDCSFTQNDMGHLRAMFFFRSSKGKRTSVTFTNCSFNNNRHNLISSSYFNSITCTKCTFRYTQPHNGDSGDVIMETYLTKLTFTDCVIFLSSGTYLKSQFRASSNVTFWNSIVRGHVTFILSHSQLNFHNSTITASVHGSTQHLFYSTGRMISMQGSSTLVMRNTAVEWNVFDFLYSMLGTVTISNCTFYMQATAPGPTFFELINSSCSMTNVHITFDISDTSEENNTPVLATYYNGSALVYFVSCDVRLESVTAVRTKPSTKLDPWEFLLTSSNATIDNCVFSSTSLHFGANNSFKLVITDSEILNKSYLDLYWYPGFILAKNATLRTFFCTDCIAAHDIHFTTLRLESTVLITQTPLFGIIELLTWKSLVMMGNTSFNTSETNFMSNAEAAGMFHLGPISKKLNSHQIESSLKNEKVQSQQQFSETEYAGGTAVTFSWISSQQRC